MIYNVVGEGSNLLIRKKIIGLTKFLKAPIYLRPYEKQIPYKGDNQKHSGS